MRKLCAGSETSHGPSLLPKMFSATNGWAGGPLRTSDGGAHWIKASPPAIPNRADREVELFLDGSDAWVGEVVGPSLATMDRVVVFSTADAGQTWEQSGPLLINPAGKSDAIERGEPTILICFVDPRHGWLLTGATLQWEDADGGPFGTSVGGLYRTSDGGLNWTPLSLDAVAAALQSAGCAPGGIGGMVFSSSTTGWLVSYQCVSSAASLVTRDDWLVTRDGGLTWAPQNGPFAYRALPYFVDATHGFTAGFITGKDARLAATSDGGLTWIVRGSLPAVPVVGKVDHCDLGDFDFFDPWHGWCIMGRVSASDTHLDLYRTSDGGQKWSPSGAVPDWGILTFFDTHTGFLSTYKDSRMADWLLYKTVDGGATWNRVTTIIVR